MGSKQPVHGRFGPSSLAVKALTILALGLGCCFVLMALLLSSTKLSTLLDLAELASRSETLLVASRLERAAEAGDGGNLRGSIESLAVTASDDDLVRPLLRQAAIFDASGSEPLAAWASTEPASVATLAEDLARRAMETSALQEAYLGDILFISTPLFGPSLGPATGAVSLGWDVAGLHQQLLRATLMRGVFSLVAAAAMLLALVSVIRRMVLLPIESLAGVVEQVLAEGDTTSIPSDLLARRDEMGRLANSFATLLANSSEQISCRRRQLDAALEHMSHGLCIFDGQNKLAVCNRRFAEIYGLDEDATRPGACFWELIEAHAVAGSHTDEQLGAMQSDLNRQLRTRQPMSYLDQLMDGRVISVMRVILPDGGWVTTVEEVTQQRQMEVQLAYMAHHDALTGLPNRVMFHQELAKALTATSAQHHLALFYLDLDGFKRVNDTLGHQIGDELLKAVAGRLRACLRSEALVARLGGDEFAILERCSNFWDNPGVLAERVIEALSQPYEILGHIVSVGTSVGIAIARSSRTDPEVLVVAADAALYKAKSEGKGCYRYASQDRRVSPKEPALAGVGGLS